ncbi:MAG TPA: type II secretion system protein GspG [Pyrinomonadaceae bacterium]|nr:type II secretion system protein GspG [Pyrinomonadaceae bacterium]
MRLLAIFVLLCGVSIHARADLSQKQARRVIQTMGGWSLPSDSVRIRSVGESGEVSAEIEAVFRLRLFEGHWQLQEIRTAPDRWERLDVIARAANVATPVAECDVPVQFATKLTTRLARCMVAALFGVTLPSDDVRIKEISPFGLSIGKESAALVTALVRADFRLSQDAKSWRVTAFKSGSRDWFNVSNLPLAIDRVKRSAASDELSVIAKALSDYRRDRGYFVVADRESVLIDHLSPKYLTRVIRVDPWHRPYQYDGQQDHYSLRSLGPDGKPNTQDDVVVSGP